MRIFAAILNCLFSSIFITACTSLPCPNISGTYKNESPAHTYHLARLFFEFQYDPSAHSYSRDIVEIAMSGDRMLVSSGNRSTSLWRGRDFECGDEKISLSNEFAQRFSIGLFSESSTNNIELKKLPNGSLIANDTRKTSGRMLIIPFWSKTISSYSWDKIDRGS